MKRIIDGYCWAFKDATICIRTGVPDFSDLVVPDVDWSKRALMLEPRKRNPRMPLPHEENLCDYTHTQMPTYATTS